MPRGRKPSGDSEREEAVRKARARRLAEKAALPIGQCDFADKLKFTMDLRGMTQSSLSRVIGEYYEQGMVLCTIHQTRISKWMLRSGEPNHKQTHALAVACNVPLAYFANPLRREKPDPRKLQEEALVEAAVSRLGYATALARLELQPNAELLTPHPLVEDTLPASRSRKP